jgi:mono/diheme cytochrome c family protein
MIFESEDLFDGHAVGPPPMRVNRGLLNLLIDSAAAALLTAIVSTGYILWFALPPGTNRTHTLWGLLRHQFGALHFYISAALLAVLALHVALHWRWLVIGLSKRFGQASWAEQRPWLAGLAVLSVAAVPLTTVAVASHLAVRPLEQPLHRQEDEATGVAPRASATDSPSGSRATVASAADRAATLLAAKCASCHGARDAAAGIRADTPSALLTEQNGVQWVATGKPDESRLLRVVGPTSATPRHRLSKEEDEVLRTWISSFRR